MSKEKMDKQRRLVAEHIQEYYPNLKDLKANCIAAHPHKILSYPEYIGARHMVEGGCFLCYYEEVHDFMKGIGADVRNFNGAWRAYIHIVSSVIMEMLREYEKNLEECEG